MVNDSSVHAVMITPGTTFPNGISREFDVSGGGSFEVNVPAIAVDGTSEFYLRVNFKNSSGTTIHTVTRSYTLDSVHQVAARLAVPTAAVDAQVVYAAKDGESGSTTVVVGGFLGIPTMPTHKVNTSWGPPEQGEECEEFTGSCECDISCDEGYDLVEDCDTQGPPACSQFGTCYCVETGEEESEYMIGSAWE